METQYTIGKRNAKGVLTRWDVPIGVTVPAIGDYVRPGQWGYDPYTGDGSDLSTDCGTPTPPSGSPVWIASGPNHFFPGPYVAGLFIEQDVPYSAITPASGKTIVGIAIGTDFPSWVTLIDKPGQQKATLTFTAPIDTTTFSGTLIARQSDDKTTPKLFVFPAIAISLQAYHVVYADTRQSVPYVAPLAGGAPSVSLTGPSAWTDTSAYIMDEFGATLGGVDYKYRSLAFKPLPDGEYYYTFKRQYLTKYAKFVIPGGDSMLTLQDTVPTLNNGGTDPTTPVTVVAVDAAFINGGQNLGQTQSQLITYIRLSGTDTCEIAYEGLDANENVIVAKSGYFSAPAYSDGTDYKFRDVLSSVPPKERLYIRPVSNRTGGEVIILYTRPSASQSRTGIYPTNNQPGPVDPSDLSGETPGQIFVGS